MAMRVRCVAGKGGTTRTVFLSADARTALADYLEHERPRDASGEAPGVFLSAVSVASAWRAALAAVDQRDLGSD